MAGGGYTMQNKAATADEGDSEYLHQGQHGHDVEAYKPLIYNPLRQMS